MQHIMGESNKIPLNRLAQPGALQLGNELKNIIARAQELEQRDAVKGEFIALKQVASYSGGSIIAVVIILGLVWKFWPREGGRPLLINKDLFPGTPSQALLPPTVHYSTTTGRVITLPHRQNKARVEKKRGRKPDLV